MTEQRVVRQRITELSNLLKDSTDMSAMEEKLDDLREIVTQLSMGGMGATLNDIRRWIMLCDRISAAMPRFVAWNRRKKRLQEAGKLSEHDKKWIQEINDGIQSTWITRLKGMAHYFLMRFMQVKYKDTVNIELTKAEGQAAAMEELAKVFEQGKGEGDEDAPRLQETNV